MRTLDNGLDVIVHEDRRRPIVAVNLWYHVGSKDERPDRTGFAHLFEHLMFEGSAHYDRSYFHPLQEAGAAINGSTGPDRTNYWEWGPTNALELALWLESDRMAYLLPALTSQKFETQRQVVLNERRQNYENRPYGLAMIALTAALFPRDHPYHWPTIGQVADLESMTLDEVQAFFAAYYHPANASLTIAGDVAPSDAFALADRYFGDIPSGRVPQRSAPSAPADGGEQRRLLADRVELPRLYLAWATPAMYTADDAPLDYLGDILGGGRTSRLYQSLVHERRLAVDVWTGQQSRELCSIFFCAATAAPGRSLADVDAGLQEEIDRLTAQGPTGDEMERTRIGAEAQFRYRLQTLGGFGGKSDQLNAYNVYLSHPGYFDEDLARYLRVDAGQVQRVAGEYLARSRRTALSVVPTGREALALSDSTPASVR
jgi:zinc protease